MFKYTSAQLKPYIEKYKLETDASSAKILVRAYDPLVWKWVKFLTTTNIQLDSPFECFLGHKTFRFIRGSANYKHEFIVRSLRSYEVEDLYQEVCISLLEAMRGSGNFIKYGIPYYLGRRVFSLIRDPLTFGSSCVNETAMSSRMDYSDSNFVEFLERKAKLSNCTCVFSSSVAQDKYYFAIKEAVVGCKVVPHTSKALTGIEDPICVYEEDGEIQVGINALWVSGETVGLGGGDVFSLLTPKEREVVVRIFILKQSPKVARIEAGLPERAYYTLRRGIFVKLGKLL